MAKYAMVIDLHKCTGCGACVIACKMENNITEGILWSDYQEKTEGTYPDVSFTYVPTLCNHCEHPPCVDVCPVDPKATFKTEDGFVLNDAERCIGCRRCEEACPYNEISYNAEEAHQFWKDEKGKEVLEAVGTDDVPYYNPNRARTWDGVRRTSVVEKCSFCDHRIIEGKEPYCNEVCPSNARFFGDLDDPDSKVSQLLEEYEFWRRKPEEGTEPNVYYIREYSK